MAEADHGHEAVYDASALAWDAERQRGFPEKFLIDRLIATCVAGADVLDLGCGTGAPIAAYLVQQGYRATGVDFSAGMLAVAKRRVSDARFFKMDIRSLSLDQRFSAIVAWDSLFHLTANEQVKLFPTLARLLGPGGRLLFTCGPEHGERWGRVSGGPVFHASLSPQEYAEVLTSVDVEVIEFQTEDPRVWGRSWCLARRVDVDK